ncbi:MAG TPA: hypothetical protein VFB23_15920 [Candidatus Acidoferrales bacterium]|nr:hypothetical protein [Candidatus Acidoferrales bacterium]
MSDQQATQPSGERVIYERCLCREVLEKLGLRLGVSPEVRQHLVNSRIELLKAIREVINDRIEHLSRRAAPGSKIPVE